MFYPDIEANNDALSRKIAGKSVLVIGGATISKPSLLLNIFLNTEDAKSIG